MANPQLQDLLEAGVHFGHQTRRWNPKMRRFIFAERSGIYIIDLQKTLRQIQKAEELLRSVVLRGEGVLFVCTKKQLKAIVQAEAQQAGAFYVTERWLGGMLTNFQTLKKQIRRLRELEQGAADDRRVLMSLGELRREVGRGPEVDEQRLQRPLGDEHRGGVDGVLAGRVAVDRRLRLRL